MQPVSREESRLRRSLSCGRSAAAVAVGAELLRLLLGEHQESGLLLGEHHRKATSTSRSVLLRVRSPCSRLTAPGGSTASTTSRYRLCSRWWLNSGDDIESCSVSPEEAQ
uniref:Uncharacterized protein n=1 Tax=Leersia perrieri TaxID=77586 RepID=A0A0D9VMG6_9ORYZ